MQAWHGENYKHGCKLYILPHCTFVYAGPTILYFIARPHDLNTSQSRRVEFQCSVHSTLIPSFMWIFTRREASNAEIIANRSSPLAADFSIIANHRSETLIISDVQWKHEGVYTCIVSSDSHQIIAEAYLNVSCKCYNNYSL